MTIGIHHHCTFCYRQRDCYSRPPPLPNRSQRNSHETSRTIKEPTWDPYTFGSLPSYDCEYHEKAPAGTGQSMVSDDGAQDYIDGVDALLDVEDE